MVPKEGKGAKPVTKIVHYLVKKCGFRYFKSFCSLCKRLFFFFFFSLLHMIRDIFELHVPMSTYQMNAQLKH